MVVGTDTATGGGGTTDCPTSDTVAVNAACKGDGDVNCDDETTNTQNKGNMVVGTDTATCCEAPSGAANGENCAVNNDCVSNNCEAMVCGAARRLLSSKANT